MYGKLLRGFGKIIIYYEFSQNSTCELEISRKRPLQYKIGSQRNMTLDFHKEYNTYLRSKKNLEDTKKNVS